MILSAFLHPWRDWLPFSKVFPKLLKVITPSARSVQLLSPAKPQVLSLAAISKPAHSQHAVADKMLLVRLDVVDPIGSSKHEAKHLDLGKLLVPRKAQVESLCVHDRDMLELKFPTCSQGFQQHVVHDQAGRHSAHADLSSIFTSNNMLFPILKHPASSSKATA